MCIRDRGKIEVPVLDATAIGVSIIRGDFATAGSVMYLLGIGETLEEWTPVSYTQLDVYKRQAWHGL